MSSSNSVSLESKGEVQKERETRALQWGQSFVLSIMNATIDSIPNSNGMAVVRNVFDLETGATGDIILRSMTAQFWQACIDVVDTPNNRIRVAAVGTPGIGKTTSTPWLIRMLLERGHTVVYLICTDDESDWYYEFVPKSDGTVTVNVYPEKLFTRLVPSLRCRSTYYVVDPSQTKNDCTPASNFKAKIILVPSPDSRHWGESEFLKRRDDVAGWFRYFPTWSLEELVFAQPILCPDMTEDQLRDRFYQFGGVPRHVFGFKTEGHIRAQDRAIRALSTRQATLIASGQMPAVDGWRIGPEPKSALLGIRQSAKDDGTFQTQESYMVSELVVQKIGAFLARNK